MWTWTSPKSNGEHVDDGEVDGIQVVGAVWIAQGSVTLCQCPIQTLVFHGGVWKVPSEMGCLMKLVQAGVESVDN